MSETRDLASLTLGDFEPHLGAAFETSLPGGSMTLAEATALDGGMREGGTFSLTFVAPPGPFVPQAVYRLAHPALGTLDLFLVPLGPDARGNLYQALFA